MCTCACKHCAMEKNVSMYAMVYGVVGGLTFKRTFFFSYLAYHYIASSGGIFSPTFFFLPLYLTFFVCSFMNCKVYAHLHSPFFSLLNSFYTIYSLLQYGLLLLLLLLFLRFTGFSF